MSRVSAPADCELRLSVATTGSRHWLILEGDLDGHTRPAVARALDTLRTEGVNDLVIDLRGLRRFDADGIEVLFDALDDAWQVRWRRPLDHGVAEAISEALLTDFFVAVDAALCRAVAASRLARQFEVVDEQPAPAPSSVVWIARRHDDEIDLT